MQDWGLYACYRLRNWSQPWTGRSKRIDTKVSILLGLQFPLFLSLTHTGERRPLRKRFFLSQGANNVRPYGYAPANLFDAVRRGRRTLRCTVKSFGSIYRVERHKVNCPKGRRSHTGVPRRAAHLHIASPQGQYPFSIFNYCFAYEKSTAFAVLFAFL